MMACSSQSSSHQSRGIQALCSLTLPYRRRQAWNLLGVMPNQPTKRPAGISVRLFQRRT